MTTRGRNLRAAALIVVLLIVSGEALSGEVSVDAAGLKPPPPDKVQILKTKDGSTLIGKIVKVEADQIEFETEAGTMTVRVDRIEQVTDVPRSSIRGSKYWFPDPNESRLYLFPTARMLPKGNGYFADYYVFFAAAGYAATDWLTLGGGMSLFPGLDIDRQLYFFTPKVGVHDTDKMSISAGALIVKIPGFDEDDDVPLIGVLDAVTTWGGRDWGLTAGVGYGFVGAEIADRPLVLLGVDKRISRRTAFVSENWILPGVDNPLISYGIRFFGESLSADLAFFNTVGEGALFPGIPFVSFVFNF
jgi:hypothetical protein